MNTNTETVNGKVIVKFDYSAEMLNKIAEEARKIDISDIEQVKEAVKVLVKARTSIQKQGKAYRDESNAYSKRVIETEKQYTSITEPIEQEYKQLIENEKQREIMEARLVLLPSKRKSLELLEYTQREVSDEDILKMDDVEWVNYLQSEMEYDMNKKIAIKKAEQDKIDQEKRDEEIRAGAEAKAKADLEAKAIREAEEKVAQEARDKAKAEADEAKLQNDKRFTDYKKLIGFNEETDIAQKVGDEIRLYKHIGSFKYDN